jgi:hypothetical protein
MTDEAYTEAMKQLQFLHVYGSLGPLPWQSTADAVSYRSHGYREILIAADNIKVLHQGAEDTVQQEFARAQAWLRWAERVLFLGFGFHDTNVRLLALGRVLSPYQKIRATCKNLDGTNRDNAEYCTPWSYRPGHLSGSPAIEFADPKADCLTFLHDAVLS